MQLRLRPLLRPFERSDAPDVFAYASNPNVARYTSWETHRTLADSEAFIEMVLWLIAATVIACHAIQFG